MKRKIIIGLAVIVLLAGAVLGFREYQLYQTKKLSPWETVTFDKSNVHIEVGYCRPYAKGRKIFGDLVPYGRWWRTGANETTQIELSRDVIFNGDTLKAGLYSLVTIPEEEEWTIIFNNRIPEWGTSYFPQDDELRIKAAVENLPATVEQFTIDFSELDGHNTLIFAWDKTKVTVPFDVL